MDSAYEQLKRDHAKLAERIRELEKAIEKSCRKYDMACNHADVEEATRELRKALEDKS